MVPATAHLTFLKRTQGSADLSQAGNPTRPVMKAMAAAAAVAKTIATHAVTCMTNARERGGEEGDAGRRPHLRGGGDAVMTVVRE